MLCDNVAVQLFLHLCNDYSVLLFKFTYLNQSVSSFLSNTLSMPVRFSLTHSIKSKNTLKFPFPSLRLVKLVLVVLFGFFSTAIYATDTTTTDATETEAAKAPKKADGTNNPLLISTEDPKLKAEKEFSKIKSYESYDPITDTWSTIEDFEDVEILNEGEKKPASSYIYRSFWAYDPVTHEWYRVDISEYGYRKVTAADLAAEDDESEEEEKPKKEWSFWKNLGISLSGGYGVTKYICQIKNMNLLVRPGQQEFFLQPRNASGAIYKLQWFTQRPIKINTLEHANLFNSYTTITHDHAFTSGSWLSMGWVNLPITLSLHYTLFNRLRIGVGANAEISYLTTLSSKNTDGEKIDYTLPRPWFLNLKYFGIVGYKIYKGEKHSFFIDGRIGMALDYGNKDGAFKELFKTLGAYDYMSLYASLGPSHEIRLNGFFKFFYGLYAQFKRFENDADFGPANSTGSKPSMQLWQPAIHLEAGITLHFGRDKKEEPDEDEEDVDNEEGAEGAIDALQEVAADSNTVNADSLQDQDNPTEEETLPVDATSLSTDVTDEVVVPSENEASTAVAIDDDTIIQLEANEQ